MRLDDMPPKLASSTRSELGQTTTSEAGGWLDPAVEDEAPQNSIKVTTDVYVQRSGADEEAIGHAS